MNLLSPEKMFDDLVPESKPWRNHVSLFENRFQYWSFVLSLLMLISAAIFAIGFSLTKNQVFATFATGTLIAFYLFVMVFQIALVVPAFKMMTAPERTILQPMIKRFSTDLQRAERLAANYQEIQIQFAQQRLALISNHLRQRILLIVGALDKVGVFPLAITAYFTLKKFEADKLPVDFAAAEWIGLALGVIYCAALILIQKAQELECHELIFKTALDLKRRQAGAIS